MTDVINVTITISNKQLPGPISTYNFIHVRTYYHHNHKVWGIFTYYSYHVGSKAVPGVTDKERDYLDIYMMMVGSGGPGGLSCIKVGLPALVMCSTDNTAVAVQVMLHISLLDSRMGHII